MGFGVLMAIYSPALVMVLAIVNWPAIQSLKAGEYVDWDATIAFTGLFVVLPVVAVFNFLASTRYRFSFDGVEKRGLFRSTIIPWSERPYVQKEKQELSDFVVQPNASSYLSTCFGTRMRLKRSFVNRRGGPMPNLAIPADRDPRERGSRPLNSHR